MKRFYLKFISAALVILTAASLCGCGGQFTKPDTPLDLGEDDKPDLPTDEKGDEAVRFEEYAYYTVQSADGKYIAASDHKLVLSDEPYSFLLIPDENGRYYIADGNDSVYFLDVSNAWYTQGNTVSLHEPTGYDAQLWDFVLDGQDCFIRSAGDNRYVLSVDGEKATIVQKESADRSARFSIVKAGDDRYKYESPDKKIVMLLREETAKMLGTDRIMKWLGNLDKAYDALSELTGYTPHETVFINAREEGEYWGCYYGTTNMIRFNFEDIHSDLEKMPGRADDWNFGALHELGHLFDDGANWVFDAEVMTDFKLLYIMDKYNAGAAPSEFPADTCFVGMDEMIEGAHRLGGDLKNGYTVYAAAAKLGEIAREIGWEPFQSTFRAFPDVKNEGVTARFEAFIRLLSEHSGRDVKGMFSEKEWNYLIAEYNKR